MFTGGAFVKETATAEVKHVDDRKSTNLVPACWIPDCHHSRPMLEAFLADSLSAMHESCSAAMIWGLSVKHDPKLYGTVRRDER